ncbi:hypothetical protein ACFW04_001329 [Cataglyphis niger]
MIPEFDGSTHKLQEFLSVTTYAVEHIDPLDEITLLGAVLCTKLKGRAMLDFQTRKIQNFAQLKNELEICYASKKSTTHLQIEFNTLKQKPGESARTYGFRADTLAIKLYESIMEKRHHTVDNKRAIMEIIQQQALENFQIGLNDDIKTIILSRTYATLQEAIAAASAEEKVREPSATSTRHRTNSAPIYKNENKINVQCNKCGKNGHYDQDCRISRYTNRFSLPKSDSSRVNAVNKFCNYCKKTGHSRDECWSLNKKPKAKINKAKDDNHKHRAKKKYTIKQFHDDERALKARVVAMMSRMKKKTELLLITLSMQQAKREKVQMLYDSGSTISLIKLKQLKDDTLIYEDKIAFTGITGHKVHTIGKVYVTIKINNQKVKHTFYVVRDDIAIEYEGILGIDFLRQHSVTCDYKYNRLKIGNAMLNLYPFNKIILKPRNETIIKARTDQNRIGIVRAEEKAPGVYIGNCIVNAADYTCPVSVINRQRKKQALLQICENFCDIFHVDGEPLTCTATVEHEINTRTDTSPVNMRPYRLPEKHKTEVNKQVQQIQWNAPLLVVPKKADASEKPKLRVIIDFRKLNDLTIGDSFSLPNITDILDQLGNAKYFTTLDLVSGYHQIPMICIFNTLRTL